MSDNSTRRTRVALLAGFLASGIVVSTALAQAQAAHDRGKPGETQPSASSPVPSPVRTSTTPPSLPAATKSVSKDAFYKHWWGVDILGVRAVSSGLMLRFSYRVLDANKANALNDNKLIPYLMEEKTGVRLEIPTLEKVGQLRQIAPPQGGREYWMVFGNANRRVRPGDRVDVVIGKFRVDGLVVE
jgi:hypothetical protein